MVSPAEWGPSAWNLLHGIAERVGNQSIPMLQIDEQTALKNMLKSLWSLLPCKTCQEHYREWIIKNPPTAFTSKSGGYLQEDMRSWVYRLHNSVNEKRGAEIKFTQTMLESTYSNINLRNFAMNLKVLYNRGLQVGVFKPSEWKAAWRQMDLLLRLIGC
jgi:hypothetical protein